MTMDERHYDRSSDEVILYAQCHCRKQTIPIRVAKSHFPLSAETCHCNDCRQITGLLANDFLMLRNELRQDLFDADSPPEGLLAYTPKRVTWYFCQRCGCHLVQSSVRPEEEVVRQGGTKHQWYVSTGIVYPLNLPDSIGAGRVYQRVRHSWVRPGLDQGGLTRFMWDGLDRYPADDSTSSAPLPKCDGLDPEPGPNAEEQKQIDAAADADSLPVRCRCGYVRLRLLRPDHHAVDEKFKVVDEKFKVVDESKRKWRFGICMCNSCRTTGGFEGGNVVIFATHHHIVADEDHASTVQVPNGYPDGALQGNADQPATRGLCTYASSDDTLRRFCPCCGSSVFIDFKEFGPDLCDVHLGNVRAPLRAVWSAWTFSTARISWLPYARDRQLAEQLRRGYAPDQDYELSEKMKALANDYTGDLVL